MSQTDDLPALPEPRTLSRGDEDGPIQLGYTADQMDAYATAARAPLLERIAELEAQESWTAEEIADAASYAEVSASQLRSMMIDLRGVIKVRRAALKGKP